MPRIWSLFAFSLLVACGGGKEAEPAADQPPLRQEPATPVASKRVDPTQVAQLRGVVTVRGSVPQAEALVLNADAWCKNHYDSPPPEESLVVHDGRLQNAFVWIESGLEAYQFDTPVEKKLLDQVGCIFGPRVNGVMVGQPLTAKNSDPVLHNVHSKPSANRGKNIALPRIGSERDFVFDKPEIMVPIVCDVHPWMRAYIGVVAHPYFAVSDAEGSFALNDLPPGEFTLGIWHEKLGEQRHTVTLAAGQELELPALEFAID